MSLLKRWKRAGYTPADIRGMYVAGQILKGNIGPQMQALLQRYGLEDMTRWVADAIVHGKSQEQIMLEIYDQPAFQKRFPSIIGREKAGLSPISVEEYLAYEQAAESLGEWTLCGCTVAPGFEFKNFVLAPKGDLVAGGAGDGDGGGGGRWRAIP
jgi:predicted cupin superfamily sugar epimerase